MPPPDPDFLLTMAGTNALMVSGKTMLQDMKDALVLVGRRTMSLRPFDERATLFAPVWIRVDGKSRPGGFLFTDRHLIVGCTEAATKLGNVYAWATPLRSIIGSPTSLTKIGPFAPTSAALSVFTEAFCFDLIFNAAGMRRDLFVLAVGLARGFASVILDTQGNATGVQYDTMHPGWTHFVNEPNK